MASFTYTFLPLRAHPFLSATIALMLGIWCQAVKIPPHLPVFVALLLACAAATRPSCKKLLTIIILSIAAFVIGGFMYNHQCTLHASFYRATNQKNLSIRGTVLNIVQIDNPRFNTIMTIGLEHIKAVPEEQWQPCPGTIQFYSATTNLPAVSDTIIVKNIAFKKPVNEDFDRYLCKEGINATLFAPNVAFTIVARPTWSLRRWFFDWRATTFATLQQKTTQRTFSLFSALFLGNKQANKTELEKQKEQFQTWGVSHQLARSGLHLIMFILVWELVLSLLPLGFALRQGIVVIISIIYFLLSWSSLGFLRALCMFFLYKFCIIMREPVSGVHVLTVICFTMLLFNPLQLFFLNFQLNFALTFALAWFNQQRTQEKRPFI